MVRVTNCSEERSFTKLKRIKKYNATRKIEQSVVDMSTEYDMLKEIDFKEVTNDFTYLKSNQVG